MDKAKVKAIKDKVVKKTVALSAAASLLAGGLFTPPAQLPIEEKHLNETAIVDTLLPETEPQPVEELVTEPEEEKKKRQKLPLYKRLLVFSGFLLADWLVVSVIASLLAALPAVLSALFTWLAGAAVTVLLGLIALKLANPGVPIKELLSRKNINTAAVVTGCLGATVLLLRYLIPDDSIFRQLAFPVASCVAFIAILFATREDH